MPRYSYVIAFPILIALCIGINIKRYPAVSEMLHGNTPESRWLGRSEAFQFRETSTSQAANYQGASSDNAEHENFVSASRDPIPLSDSRRSSSSSRTSTYSDSTDGSRAMSSYRPSETSDRYSSSYGGSYSDDSSDSRNSGSWNSRSETPRSETSRTESSAMSGTRGGSSRTSSQETGSESGGIFSGISWGGSTKNNRYGSDNDTSDNVSSEENTSAYESIPSSAATTSNRYGYDASAQSESMRFPYSASYPSEQNSYDLPQTTNVNRRPTAGETTSGSSSPDTSSRNGFRSGTMFGSEAGSVTSDYHVDTPSPGYSSVFSPLTADGTESPASQASTGQSPTSQATTAASTASSSLTATSSVETSPPVRERPRTLTPQEKLELRLATPFSLTPSESEDKNGTQYIPPDFLPAHENGDIGRLVVPEAEAPTSINGITFDIPGASADQSDTETEDETE